MTLKAIARKYLNNSNPVAFAGCQLFITPRRVLKESVVLKIATECNIVKCFKYNLTWDDAWNHHGKRLLTHSRNGSHGSHDSLGYPHPVLQMWQCELRQTGEQLLQRRTMIQGFLSNSRTTPNRRELEKVSRSWGEKSRGVSLNYYCAPSNLQSRALVVLVWGGFLLRWVQPPAHLQKPATMRSQAALPR